MIETQEDRLFQLLPAVYRLRDAAQGSPLRALLRVIAGQVNLIEADIDQLYQNWFIETCEDWVVPYIADLIGYQNVHEAGQPDGNGQIRDRILIPRQEVANTIGYRRRKGTLALLEQLAMSSAGWPARAVEFFHLLGLSQGSRRLVPGSGQTVDLRKMEPLNEIDSPFDLLPHTIDVRRTNASNAGRYNIPSVGLFVWRLKTHPVTYTPAYNYEQIGPNFFTFSTLGNDAPLFTRIVPESSPTTIAGEINLPGTITRYDLDAHKDSYYGSGKSLQIWVGEGGKKPPSPVPPERIVAADLTDWYYRPKRGQVAVDPELGRIAFHPREAPRYGMWVSYYTAFSADIGGGEYNRPISQPKESRTYRVGDGETFKTISTAVTQWQQDAPQHAVIEIMNSGVYVEPVTVRLLEKQTLQLRAANHVRPVIRLLDWQTDRPDALWVTGEPGSRFTLDGILVTGRGIQVQGMVRSVTIRHSTLVPGWSLFPDCEPRRPNEPSIEMTDTTACLVIEHSIVGSIQVNQDEVEQEPLLIRISDSILDATSPDREALGAPNWLFAHAVLTVQDSTVIGQVQTYAIELAENSIFLGKVRVARSQRGCMRFCYVDPRISRTPRRFNCQPDLILRAVDENKELNAEERQRERDAEAQRVLPRLDSQRYGTPEYCRLSTDCAPEIRRGAADESEMGVFHDLFQPQREANLRARLDEYLPAGMQAGIIFVD
jgi:hypothetical protein